MSEDKIEDREPREKPPEGEERPRRRMKWHDNEDCPHQEMDIELALEVGDITMEEAVEREKVVKEMRRRRRPKPATEE